MANVAEAVSKVSLEPVTVIVSNPPPLEAIVTASTSTAPEPAKEIKPKVSSKVLSKSKKAPPPPKSDVIPEVYKKGKSKDKKITFEYDKNRVPHANFLINAQSNMAFRRKVEKVLGKGDTWVIKDEYVISEISGLTGLNGEKKVDEITMKKPMAYYNEFLKSVGVKVVKKDLTGFHMFPVVDGKSFTKEIPKKVEELVKNPEDLEDADLGNVVTEFDGAGEAVRAERIEAKPEVKVEEKAQPTKEEREESENVKTVENPTITEDTAREVVLTSKDLFSALQRLETQMNNMSQVFMRATQQNEEAALRLDVSGKPDSRYNKSLWKAVLCGLFEMTDDQVVAPLAMVLKDSSKWSKVSFWADVADEVHRVLGDEEEEEDD